MRKLNNIYHNYTSIYYMILSYNTHTIILLIYTRYYIYIIRHVYHIIYTCSYIYNLQYHCLSLDLLSSKNTGLSLPPPPPFSSSYVSNAVSSHITGSPSWFWTNILTLILTPSTNAGGTVIVVVTSALWCNSTGHL